MRLLRLRISHAQLLLIPVEGVAGEEADLIMAGGVHLGVRTAVLVADGVENTPPTPDLSLGLPHALSPAENFLGAEKDLAGIFGTAGGAAAGGLTFSNPGLTAADWRATGLRAVLLLELVLAGGCLLVATGAVQVWLLTH